MTRLETLAAVLATANPSQVIEVVRLALERARELGCAAVLADAIDVDLKARRTPTEAIELVPTEPPQVAPPRGGA